MISSGARKTALKKAAIKLLVPAFWLCVWEVACLAAGSELLLPSPVQTFLRLFELAGTGGFWLDALMSLARIVEGFLLGVLAGTVLGAAAARLKVLNEFLSPVVNIIKSTPVASFIILALVWIKKDGVPVFISFLMVLPILWGNVTQGIAQTDKGLLEMANLFRFGRRKTVTKVYVPSVMPYFFAGCTTALGLAWKAGVAAEVLSLPARSIGRELYNAKIYLETTDLFAWSAAVILLSIVLEKLLVAGLDAVKKR